MSIDTTASHRGQRSVQRSVRFPVDQHDELVTLAAREERSVAQVIKRAVRDAVERAQSTPDLDRSAPVA